MDVKYKWVCALYKLSVLHIHSCCTVKALSNLPRDEKVVSRAIELNEQLQKVLARHDALMSGRPTSTANHFSLEETDGEEEAEQLFRRYVHVHWTWVFP